MTEWIRISELRELALTPPMPVPATLGAFTVRLYPRTLLALLDAVEAAARLHGGLTCLHDPMDVDERIEHLGAALARFDFR